MAIQEAFLVFLLAVLSVRATSSNECPPQADIPRCACDDTAPDGTIHILCPHASTLDERLKELQKSLAGKRNIILTVGSTYRESRLTSKVLDGLHIRELKIQVSNVTRWADVEGGPAFVGLEDTLEKLQFEKAILPRKPNNYELETLRAPMTLGHLRKLRVVRHLRNRIFNLGNDWFRNGPDSLEDLELSRCRIELIGDRAFTNLPNLKRIAAPYNEVEKVTRSMFPNPANHLVEIDFGNNKLTDLPDDMFTNMPALTWVNFHRNGLTHLSEITWRPVWSRLHVLYVTANELVCDDTLAWTFNQRLPATLRGECVDKQDEGKSKDLAQFIKENQSEEK